MSGAKEGAGSAVAAEPAPSGSFGPVSPAGLRPPEAQPPVEELHSPPPGALCHRDSTRPVIGRPGSIANVQPRITTGGGVYRPAMVVDVATVGQVRLAAASLKGTAHQEFGTVRQDSYGLGVVGEDYAVIAVADGVSQAKHSHIAANLACQTAVSTTVQSLTDGVELAQLDWAGVIDEVRAVIRRRAVSTLPPDAADFSQGQIDYAIASQVMSTTLDVAVLRTAGAPTEFVVARLAGDGSVYLHEHGTGWTVLSAGKDADNTVVSTRVQALPLDPGPPRVLHGVLAAGQALMVCTDGIGDHLGAGENELGQFLSAAWGQPVAGPEFLRTLDFVHAGALDDRTAVVAW